MKNPTLLSTLLFAKLAVGLSGCIGVSPPPSANAESDWSIEKYISRRDTFQYRFNDEFPKLRGPEGSVFLFLVREGERWAITDKADITDPNVEALWMEPRTKTIGLATVGTSPNMAESEWNVCDNTVSGDRAKVGYSLCNSALKKRQPGIDFVFAPLQAAAGTEIAAYWLDVEEVQSALDGRDIDELYAMAAREYDYRARMNNVRQLDRQVIRQRELAEADRARAEWYDGLRSGDTLPCGLLLEKRDAMALIQFERPFGGETRWIRVADIKSPVDVQYVIQRRDHCRRLAIEG